MSGPSLPPLPPSVPLIRYEELEIDDDLIGSGAHGAVYKAKLHGTHVAVKAVLAAQREQLEREMTMLAVNRHPCIINLLGVSVHDKLVYFIFPWMHRGSLAKCALPNYIEGNKILKVLIALDISRGMNYLHNRKILHRDLKADNVLIQSLSKDPNDVRVVICDFDRSREDATMMTANIGTPRNMAPELFEPGKEYSNKIDVYSFGILLWQMSTSCIPFEKVHLNLIPFTVMNGGRPDIPPYLRPEISEMIASCWHQDPLIRPSFAQLIPILEGIYSNLVREQAARERARSDEAAHNSVREQALRGVVYSKRLLKEHSRLSTETIPGTIHSVSAVGGNLQHVRAAIYGPPDTFYAGGIFRLEVFADYAYPMVPLKASFLTSVFHPNISPRDGRVSLDILQDKWYPFIQIRTVCSQSFSLNYSLIFF
eukprot:TRINITY_DN15589_c0_g1_i2.p1 TRINITY_DN15589_c0_g1~~TRINITY_DN15589_c0_g1_i2.p1  ORF type:complete len:432 (+),score=12.71 TRINITY_DN15589_c0_g1_i2:24-1298(+)